MLILGFFFCNSRFDGFDDRELGLAGWFGLITDWNIGIEVLIWEINDLCSCNLNLFTWVLYMIGFGIFFFKFKIWVFFLLLHSRFLIREIVHFCSCNLKFVYLLLNMIGFVAVLFWVVIVTLELCLRVG